jgi:hypothetical protein
MAEKYVEDGKIGVLYSPGFGAGWSTWGEPEYCYDKDLVEAFINGGKDLLCTVAEAKYPDAYMGGLRDIKLTWIEQGTAFRINEYDGSESIEYLVIDNFIIA